MVGGEDDAEGAGGTDDDIGAVEVAVDLFEGNGIAAKRLGKRLRVLEISVGDDHVAYASGDQVFEREFGHLTGADDEDGLAGEVHENGDGEIDGDGADGNAARADLALGTDFLGDGECALEERVHDFVRGLFGVGENVGVMDLAENLLFANDEAVEAGGDSEEVSDGFLALVIVKGGVEF